MICIAATPPTAGRTKFLNGRPPIPQAATFLAPDRRWRGDDSREGREHGAKSLSHGGILANSALLARLSLDLRPRGLLPNDFRTFQFLSGARPA
jgi:hypothetical protein